MGLIYVKLRRLPSGRPGGSAAVDWLRSASRTRAASMCVFDREHHEERGVFFRAVRVCVTEGCTCGRCCLFTGRWRDASVVGEGLMVLAVTSFFRVAASKGGVQHSRLRQEAENGYVVVKPFGRTWIMGQHLAENGRWADLTLHGRKAAVVVRSAAIRGAKNRGRMK